MFVPSSLTPASDPNGDGPGAVGERGERGFESWGATVPGEAATRSPECLMSSAATLSTRLVGVLGSAMVTWTIGVIPSDIVSDVCG